MTKKIKKDINDTDICYFSIPMPFDTKVIDYIASVNKEYKKCQINTLFNNFPAPLNEKFNEWVMVNRGINTDITSYDDFARYAEYAQSKGFKVCFLMNSPKPFSKKDYESFKKEFLDTIEMIKKTKISNIKFSNIQIAGLMKKYFPEVKLSSSTASEYNSISQYRYLLTTFPNIEQINVAISQNHNFALLKSLRQEFPNIDLEIMVNEPCMNGCPARLTHISSMAFCNFDCRQYTKNEHALYFCKSTFIYPWWLNEYLKLGINHFKFFPTHNKHIRANYKTLYPLLNYMDCVEYGIEGITANRFFSKIFSYEDSITLPENILLTDIIDLLPQIQYFIKNGHKCSYNCGVNCKYCYNCAAKLKNFIIKNGGSVM